MICVWLRQAGNVHFTKLGGSVGSDSVAGATKRRNVLDRCVAQFNLEHATTQFRIEPAFTLDESAFDIRIISEAGRDTDLGILVGWISRIFPEVIAEWSIIDKALDAGNDVLRIWSDALQDAHKASAVKPQVDLAPINVGKAPNAPSVALVAPVSAVEEESGICALESQENQSPQDETCPTNTTNAEARGRPLTTGGNAPMHADPGCNSVCTRREDWTVALDDLLDPQDGHDFARDTIGQTADEIPLPASLVLTSLEMERLPSIEMMVDRSEHAVMYQGKDETVVILLETRKDKEKLLKDPSAGAFEDCGKATFIRALNATSSDDEC